MGSAMRRFAMGVRSMLVLLNEPNEENAPSVWMN
jgi:hypothetical protein